MTRLALALVAACSANPGDPGTIDAALPLPDASPFDAPPPGMQWVPAGGGWTGTACPDGLRYQATGKLAYACTTTGGFRIGTVATDGTIAWADANTGIDNLAGAALATHPVSLTQLAYLAKPSGGANVWFRSSDDGATWTGMPITDDTGASRDVYGYRFQPSVGNMIGSWTPPASGGDGNATVMTARPAPPVPNLVATATGTVRGFAGAVPTDLFAIVYGKTPSGGDATGGVFHSIDGAAHAWSESDTGIAAADTARVQVLAGDPGGSNTMYVGLDGGGLFYATTDDGATWMQASSGLPDGASVVAITIAPGALYVSTTVGLYTSVDHAASWQLAGFGGQAVLSVAVDPTNAAHVVVAVDDATGLYRAM